METIEKTKAEEDIKKIFKTSGIYAKKENKKTRRNYGMITVINKENSLFYFSSYILAYEYFLEMNWI